MFVIGCALVIFIYFMATGNETSGGPEENVEWEEASISKLCPLSEAPEELQMAFFAELEKLGFKRETRLRTFPEEDGFVCGDIEIVPYSVSFQDLGVSGIVPVVSLSVDAREDNVFKRIYVQERAVLVATPQYVISADHSMRQFFDKFLPGFMLRAESIFYFNKGKIYKDPVQVGKGSSGKNKFVHALMAGWIGSGIGMYGVPFISGKIIDVLKDSGFPPDHIAVEALQKVADADRLVLSVAGAVCAYICLRTYDVLASRRAAEKSEEK